ncbi:uncharacterized protein [Prorops nasuta]|uniref:uncharacterized protein n=1 Tax=Prorops nasuta TaxID=863751 RepID=UPI0034CD1F59
MRTDSESLKMTTKAPLAGEKAATEFRTYECLLKTSSNGRHQNHRSVDINDEVKCSTEEKERSLNGKRNIESRGFGDLASSGANDIQDMLDQALKWRRNNLYNISSQGQWKYLNANYKEELSEEYCSMINDTSSMSSNNARNILQNVREYLASYQESYGTPRTEYSFVSLIRIMGQVTGRSLLALLYIVINIFPILEMFLHIMRFTLDKAISIQNTGDLKQRIIKYLILAVQLLSVYISLTFIFGFIVLPIVKIAINVTAKVLLYD